MDLYDMQDLLNNLNAKFKVSIHSENKALVLRIFHEDSSNFTDIGYDINGKHPLISFYQNQKQTTKGERQ